MKSEEARIAEAIAALTARLESWQVDDALQKAAEYVRDMVRNGWRPRALAATPPAPTRPDLRCLPTPEYLAARQAATQPPTRDTRPWVPETETEES
jgi:hypothetical protein